MAAFHGKAAMNDGLPLDAARIQESLKSAQWLYRAIGESIAYGVWVCDASGRNLYASDSFLRLVGLTQEECSGFGWGEALHPDDRERTVNAWRECVATGGNWDIEHRFRGADGRYHHVLARGVPVRDADGKVICWAGINLEIDRLKHAEEELREVDRRKDEFLATLAHELRNPLAPIRNAAHVIRTKAINDPQLQRAQEIIDRQVDHLSRLVDDLLDISRITHGKIEMRRERLPLRTAVEYAIEVVRPLIEARRHELVFEPLADEAWVTGDSARISQSIANLLNNAAKFTEPGGRISVTMARGPASVTVRIADDGIGIPESLLGRLFDVFTQGDRSLDRSQGGLGLGLALVRKLVELHGGRVWATSAGAGRGSEFSIELPLAALQEPEQVAEARAPRAPGPHRVLVVDDNRDAAETTAELLRRDLHEVRTAYSGAAALGVARVFSPQVVFLDIGLPSMDGYEIARRLRSFPETANARLIALTGYGQRRDVELAREAGFDEHVVKPVDPARLLELAAIPSPADYAATA
jgi:two-component system CheB/CheR fusion protein